MIVSNWPAYLRTHVAVCVIALFTAPPALAQAITILQGTVTDQATGQPISGAAVFLYGPSQIGVHTDVNGNYAITGQQWPYTGSAEMWIVAPGYFTPVLSAQLSTAVSRPPGGIAAMFAVATGIIAAWLAGATFWWVVAGAMLGSVIPFTLIVILPTNKQLLSPTLDRRSAEAGQLLARWGKLHAVRSVLSAVALVLFLYLSIFTKSM